MWIFWETFCQSVYICDFFGTFFHKKCSNNKSGVQLSMCVYVGTVSSKSKTKNDFHFGILAPSPRNIFWVHWLTVLVNLISTLLENIWIYPSVKKCFDACPKSCTDDHFCHWENVYEGKIERVYTQAKPGAHIRVIYVFHLKYKNLLFTNFSHHIRLLHAGLLACNFA